MFKNVIFDFDSTLVTIEGLDEIARKHGQLDKVDQITKAGMNGTLPFSESLKTRFDLISPTLEDALFLADLYKKSFTFGAVDLINELQNKGYETFVSTGGIKAAVLPAALKLGFKGDHIFAVCTTLEADLLKLKESCLMTKDFGKIEIAKQIARTGPTVMIGDGMTDLEAGKYATKFIGFGGIVQRESVKSLSEDYITDPSLYKLLELC